MIGKSANPATLANTVLIFMAVFLCLGYFSKFRSIVAAIHSMPRPKSRFDYRHGGNAAWKEKVEAVPLSSITPAKIESWKRSYIEPYLNQPAKLKQAKNTVNSHLRFARSLFSTEFVKALAGFELPKPLDRTVVESMAPVDVVSQDLLQLASPSSELMDKLEQIVPAYDVERHPISEGGSFVRPATLDGLSPDMVLVLINGKRQHLTAQISVAESQGVDLAQVPSFAVKAIEVLRDGASAQYGSDAIAGVIDIILKDRIGFEGYAQVGQYYGGDGFNRQAGMDYGVGLPLNGFLNVELEWTKADRTSRSRQRPNALQYIIDFPQNAKFVRNPVQPWGQPEREAKRLALNSQIDLTPSIKFYAYGLYGEDVGVDDFNWRNPETNGAFVTSSLFNQYFPGSTWKLIGTYPGGFTPQFGTAANDLSTFVGVKGETAFKLSWDISASYGRSVIDYNLSQTINASFGPLSPTAFNVGGLRQRERIYNADFVYRWDTGVFAKPLNVAFGAESRQEKFALVAGDYASWAAGPLIDMPVGSNGYPGWTPLQAQQVTSSQNNSAGYVDLETNLTSRLGLGVAGRYERYPTFGSSTTGKISARYELGPELAVRATASTGFHAPTPGLSNYTQTSQGLAPGTSILQESGQLGVNNPVAQLFGAKPLKPEKSGNISFGVVATPTPALSISLDAYSINVKGRLSLSQDYYLTVAQQQQLAKTGVVDALNISDVYFITNAYSTLTSGVDLVASYTWTLSKTDSVKISAAYNYNKTQVTHFDPNLISQDVYNNFQNQLPHNAGNVSANYQTGKWSVAGAVRYYGTYTDSELPIYQTFSAMYLFDLSATYKVFKHLSVTVGAENLFNKFPDQTLYVAGSGALYSRFAPYDTDGGRWFVRMSTSF